MLVYPGVSKKDEWNTVPFKHNSSTNSIPNSRRVRRLIAAKLWALIVWSNVSMSRLEREEVGQSWTYVPCKNTYHVIYMLYIFIQKRWCVYVNLHYGSIWYIYIYIHYITLHYITLHYITLHYVALHYITLHCVTLHYITYIHININKYMYIKKI